MVCRKGLAQGGEKGKSIFGGGVGSIAIALFMPLVSIMGSLAG
jgi:hypothetical protein